MNHNVLPPYIDIAPDERGQSLGLSVETFRCLAITALSITGAYKAGPSTMAIFKKSGSVWLHIFLVDHLLILGIHRDNTISLFATHLDSTAEPTCLALGDGGKESWHKLCETAKQLIA
jgi:hypothetical protein